MPLTTAYCQPRELPRSNAYQVSIDGVACDVLRVPFNGGQQADVVIAAAVGALDIEIRCSGDTNATVVRRLTKASPLFRGRGG